MYYLSLYIYLSVYLSIYLSISYPLHVIPGSSFHQIILLLVPRKHEQVNKYNIGTLILYTTHTVITVCHNTYQFSFIVTHIYSYLYICLPIYLFIYPYISIHVCIQSNFFIQIKSNDIFVRLKFNILC